MIPRAAAALMLAALAAAAPAGARAQQSPGIDCNLFGPRKACPPNLLYPPGQDLRLNVQTPPDDAAPAPRAERIDTIRQLFVALRACWRPPAQANSDRGMQISVRLSFNRDGYIIGTPRITYMTHRAPESVREDYRQAVMDSLHGCEPLPLTKALGGAIAGRPIAIRYIDERNIRKIGV
jgi:hypothetical protein